MTSQKLHVIRVLLFSSLDHGDIYVSYLFNQLFNYIRHIYAFKFFY